MEVHNKYWCNKMAGIINKLIFIILLIINILKGTLINESRILMNINGSVSDFFASSTAMNKQFIVIGTFKDDVNGIGNMGSVSVFSRNGIECKFKRKIIPYDGKANDYFGLSLALSEKFLLVGSLQDLDKSRAPSRGSVYFYFYNESDWVFHQKVIAEEITSSVQFGVSVAIDDNVAVVGGGCAHGRGYDVAAFHVLYYNNTTWSHKQLLTTTDSSYDNTYGTSVAITTDFIALGISYVSINMSDYAGVVYLYKHTKDTWVQHTVLTSSEPVKYGWFGRSISMQGNRLVVGAEGENRNKGNIYVYIYRDNVWSLERNLKPADQRYILHFGFAVSFDRQTILVGSFRSKPNRSRVGIPYVFKLINGSWVEYVELVEHGVIGYDLFGRSLVVFNDTVAVGVYGKGMKNGSAYVFKIPPITRSVSSDQVSGHFPTHKTKHIRTSPSTEGKGKTKGHVSLLIAVLIPSLLFFTIVGVIVRVKCNTTQRTIHTEGETMEGTGTEYIDDTSDNILLINDPFT